MSYFDQLYAAAISNDDVTIKKLLASGVSIDMRDDSVNFTTVAGRLVFDGKVDVAMRLVHQFGAGPEHVVYALCKTNQHALGQVVAAEFGINLGGKYFQDMLTRNEIYGKVAKDNKTEGHPVEVSSHAGDLENIEHLRSKQQQSDSYSRLKIYYPSRSKSENLLRTIIVNAAHGGHLKMLEKFFTKYKSIFKKDNGIGYELFGMSWLSIVGHNSYRFVNAKLALHSLTFIDNDAFREALVEQIKESGVFNYEESSVSAYDIDEVNQKSLLVREAMRSLNVPFSKALHEVDHMSQKKVCGL